MKQIELRQTIFKAVPLKNVVGVGNSTAYQISVSRGKVHATMGQLDYANREPANDSPSAHVASVHQPRRVFNRIFCR